jgi:hypothetical protein
VNSECAALSALERRVAALEGAGGPAVRAGAMARVSAACRALGLTHRFAETPRSEYYCWPLARRAALLGAPSPQHLCKSVLLKNCAWEAAAGTDGECARWQRDNCEFYLVILQYCAELDNERLVGAVRALLPEAQRKPRARYSFRLANAQESAALAGGALEHNALAAVGMLDARVPVILASAVAELRPPVCWLGGGEVDVKLLVNVPQFIAKTGALVLPVSDARPEMLPTSTPTQPAAAPPTPPPPPPPPQQQQQQQQQQQH